MQAFHLTNPSPKFAYRCFLISMTFGASSCLFVALNWYTASLSLIQWLLSFIYARKRYALLQRIQSLQSVKSYLRIFYFHQENPYKAEIKGRYCISDVGTFLMLYVPQKARFEFLWISARGISQKEYSIFSVWLQQLASL